MDLDNFPCDREVGVGDLGKDSFVGRKVEEALLEHGTLSGRRLVVTSCPWHRGNVCERTESPRRGKENA